MKKLFFICLLWITLVLIGCSTKNKIEKWDLVTITYTGFFKDGTIFETKEALIHAGVWEIIKGIDQKIIGMKKWSAAKIPITPAKGYGNIYSSNNIQKVAKIIFDKLGIVPSSGDVIILGSVKGMVRGIEKDIQGNENILFDINPIYTFENTIYSITINDIQKADAAGTGYIL